MQAPDANAREEAKTLRASVLGHGQQALRDLLAAVASSLGVDVRFGAPGDAVDVVFVLVTARNVASLLADARGAARGKPIIAVLDSDDRRVVQRAGECGARGSFALGTPPQLLRFLLVTVAMPSRMLLLADEQTHPIRTS